MKIKQKETPDHRQLLDEKRNCFAKEKQGSSSHCTTQKQYFKHEKTFSLCFLLNSHTHTLKHI